MKQYNPTLKESDRSINDRLAEIDRLESRITLLKKEIVMMKEYQDSLLSGECTPGYSEVDE